MQLARRADGYAIGTSRTASKRRRADLLSLGLALDGGAAWDRGVMEATGGRGADVIPGPGGGTVPGDATRLRSRWEGGMWSWVCRGVAGRRSTCEC